MKIRAKSRFYEIPNYSLTGDLIAYLGCGLQYRFNNKGSMPPSVPVQQWFGEFIHGVMEEAFLRWKNGTFDIRNITFDDVQPISVSVANRLEAKGMHPYANLFQKEDVVNGKKASDFLANKRAFKSLYTWAPSLFPLIEGNEVQLSCTRKIPVTERGSRTADYSMTGVADVISSVKIENFKLENRIMQYLSAYDEIKDCIDNRREFEIIIDYKGTARPNLNDDEWDYHKWQLFTYMWLRRQQLISEGSDMPVVAGILLYLNELEPSSEFNKHFINIVNSKNTDIMPIEKDLSLVTHGKPGSERFKISRSIRVIPYNESEAQLSLEKFDSVVAEIEARIQSEMKNPKDVMSHWDGNFRIERCTACDAKTFCPYAKEGNFKPTVP